MAELPLPSEICNLPFEEAMAELERLVSKLESGQVKLDEAMAAYERGSLLRRHCEGKLNEAKAKLERISQNADGTFSTSPADLG
jgi:exodeoxyribonuclease VII small subunit